MSAPASPIEPPPITSAANLSELIQRSLPRCRASSIDHLTRTVRLHHARPRETIFRQGQPVSLTLMLKGYGAFRRTTVTGQQVTVGLANEGEMFGITSISATVASVDLLALTEAELGSWPGETLRQLAASDPDLALDVIDRMAGFLTILTHKVDGFLHQDARQRVLRILARHRDLFFSDPPVLTRSHLHGLVGTSREMTGRVLRDLERDGVVGRVGRTGLRLLDPGALGDGAADEPHPPVLLMGGERRRAERRRHHPATGGSGLPSR